MNLNATLFAQFVVFFILAGFTMKFVWPPLMKALDERAERIANGLAAADRGKADLAAAEKRVQAEMAGARDEVQKRIVDAGRRAGTEWYIVEQDNPADPMADVERSFQNLQRFLTEA